MKRERMRWEIRRPGTGFRPGPVRHARTRRVCRLNRGAAGPPAESRLPGTGPSLRDARIGRSTGVGFRPSGRIARSLLRGAFIGRLAGTEQVYEHGSSAS